MSHKRCLHVPGGDVCTAASGFRGGVDSVLPGRQLVHQVINVRKFNIAGFHRLNKISGHVRTVHVNGQQDCVRVAVPEREIYIQLREAFLHRFEFEIRDDLRRSRQRDLRRILALVVYGVLQVQQLLQQVLKLAAVLVNAVLGIQPGG